MVDYSNLTSIEAQPVTSAPCTLSTSADSRDTEIADSDESSAQVVSADLDDPMTSADVQDISPAEDTVDKGKSALIITVL